MVQTPTFSPASAYFETPQNITISTATVGAVIRYTTDGSVPTNSIGAIYTGPINISGPGTITIKAVAYLSGCSDSIVATANYYYKVKDPTFSPSSGSLYTTPQNVTIFSATAGSTIRYTTDGSIPTNSVGMIYSDPVNITGTTIIKAVAYISGGLADSNVTTSSYYYYVATPTISPSGGTFLSPQNVIISTTTAGAIVRYTTDGTTPISTNGIVYEGPIAVSETITLKAVAYKSGWNESSIINAYYYFNVANPIFSPTGGTYSDEQNIVISTVTSGASICYTTNGTTPTSTTGTLYTGPISISGPTSTTIRAIAYKTGWTDSNVINYTYNFKMPYPIFNPISGSFATLQDVTISSGLSDAIIRYTIDGSTPTSTNGALYTGPINVANNTTIKAYASKIGWSDSIVFTGSYVFHALYNDDFETGNFSKYSWTLGGNVSPMVQSVTKYEGQYAAKFGTITHSQNSYFSISVQNSNTANISFCYKVSSESNCDYLRFIVDGSTVKSDAGEIDWTYYSYTLSPGTHTLKWQYLKDGSVNIGFDTAWVDNILIY
jgi:hypothetical protein